MIVDSHVHVFPPRMIAARDELVGRDATFAEMYSDRSARMATAEELIVAMDGDGVDASVVMGIGWADPDLAKESNDYIAEAVARHSDRLVGFGSVNPAATGAVREAERCRDMGLRGIGELHSDTQGFDPSDEAVMVPLLELAHSSDMTVLLHCSEPVGHEYPGKGTVTPDKVVALAKIAGDARLILAHWGGGLPFYALMPEVARTLSNVYYDTAASPFLYDSKVFAIAISLVGVERILAASDFPLLPFARIRRQVEGTTLTEQERRAILGGNAARILGL